MVYLLKMVIFHSYVSLPEGKSIYQNKHQKYEVVGPEDRIFPVSLTDPFIIRAHNHS